ncbi:hypothetical protein [Methylomonas fluvii]|uniref:Uncharacterized protein n=1 Tax=Methylomonas fluvii TaxID=1854564 RepID=A0ABR9DHY4_9GAMM|nr:hypothetical protein [Methylomonas fluvii]MBD9362715.1 hypothetical protein [Methylomonas fluvii]
MSKKIAIATTGAATAVASVSQAAALAATDFGSIQADVIGTIGVAAAIGVAIMVVGLGWDVGLGLVRKYVKRGTK